MTKVFTHGGAKVSHPEKGTFTIAIQRLKPYYGGEVLADKQVVPLTAEEAV